MAYDFEKINTEMASLCLRRIKMLGLKGKRADDAACDIYSGAFAGAHAAGHDELAANYGRILAMIVAPRGLEGVRKMWPAIARVTGG